MLGERRHRLLKPEVKKRRLMIITAAHKRSSRSPRAAQLPSKKAGRGQENIICPMDTYIRTKRNPRDSARRFLSRGVSLSRRASSSSFSRSEGFRALSAPRRDAP